MVMTKDRHVAPGRVKQDDMGTRQVLERGPYHDKVVQPGMIRQPCALSIQPPSGRNCVPLQKAADWRRD